MSIMHARVRGTVQVPSFTCSMSTLLSQSSIASTHKSTNADKFIIAYVIIDIDIVS